VKKPIIIKIGPYSYSLSFKKKIVDEGEVCLGLTHHYPQKIEVQKNLAPDLTKVVVLHEILHCCMWAAHMPNIDSELEEELVDRLAPILLELLRQNPELRDILEV
jgi:hypothetical protein